MVDLGSLDTMEEIKLVAAAVLTTLWEERVKREPVLVVIDEAHNVCSAEPEGELSRIRAHLVRQETLVMIAQELQLQRYIFLGEGELKSGGLERPSILADAVEAIFGAIFCDADFATAQAVVTRLFTPILRELDPNTAGKDAKTQLQERLQGQKLPTPKYEIVAIDGAAHEQLFTVSCEIPALQIRTQGEGSTRRLAEQHAASLAMVQLNDGAPTGTKSAKRS